MTALDTYTPADGPTWYGAQLAVTPEQAKALDDQVRRCTEAVLRENVDYGIIPGTNGEKSLWRPGAQKLLQWFRLGYTCERVEVERDDAGRKHGITYRCEVKRRHPDGTYETLASIEGTADYDEPKFCQDAETVKARLRDAEHKWAAKDRRAPNADRWNNAREWRADWNTVMQRAQKRAIVNATRDATAAGGLFSDREEDDGDNTPPPEDDGPTWYEQALDYAHTFTTPEHGDRLIQAAANAHMQGKCSKRQQDHVQNTARKRIEKLQKAAVVIEADDLTQDVQDAAEGSQDTAEAENPPDDDRHKRLIGAVQGQMKRLGYAIDDSDREERLTILAKLARVSREGTDWYQSTSDFDEDELKIAARVLTRCKDREELDRAIVAAGESDG